MNCFHPQAAGACAAFILVSAIVISCGHSVVHALESGPRKLEFYLHERTVAEPGYEATDVLAAMPSGNASYFSFGNLGWAEHVIREGVSTTSKILGRAPVLFPAQPRVPNFCFAEAADLGYGLVQWHSHRQRLELRCRFQRMGHCGRHSQL